MLDPDWGSSTSPGGAMGISGSSVSSGSEWTPSDHPVRDERGGVAPGWLKETSVVFLLSNLWLPIRGLEMRGGESRACSLRVVEDECSRTLPSGFPTAFAKWVWKQCGQTVSPLRILSQLQGRCWCAIYHW